MQPVILDTDVASLSHKRKLENPAWADQLAVGVIGWPGTHAQAKALRGEIAQDNARRRTVEKRRTERCRYAA